MRTVLGHRRIAMAAAGVCAAAAFAGCSSGDDLTIRQASSLGAEKLAALETTLVGHDEPVVGWHASSSTTPTAGCAQGEQTWTGLATATVRARTGDGDSATTEVSGRLGGAGWDPGLQAGDLDDEPAALIPAEPTGKNPAGLRLTVTVERGQGTWHYVVAMTSACASRR